MRYFLICDTNDTYIGLRMAGIDGIITKDRREVEAKIEEVEQDSSIAVLIITESLANLCRERINHLKRNAARPLVVEIPGKTGTTRTPDSITRYIREAIGIKL